MNIEQSLKTLFKYWCLWRDWFYVDFWCSFPVPYISSHSISLFHSSDALLWLLPWLWNILFYFCLNWTHRKCEINFRLFVFRQFLKNFSTTIQQQHNSKNRNNHFFFSFLLQNGIKIDETHIEPGTEYHKRKISTNMTTSGSLLLLSFLLIIYNGKWIVCNITIFFCYEIVPVGTLSHGTNAKNVKRTKKAPKHNK